MIGLQDSPLEPQRLIEQLRSDGDGAVAVFVGTVRDHNRGRPVRYLEYHAYPEMAEREMRRLASEARERYAIGGVTLVHRTGRLEIGEASVVVAVAAPHRAAAFDACRFLIDALKRTVPVWKKEFFEGGEAWIEGS